MVTTHLDGHVLDQLRRIPPAAAAGLGAQVDEVVAVVIAVAHDIVLGVVQQGQQLLVVSPAALGGELPREAPQAAAQRRPPIVHGLAGKDPGQQRLRVSEQGYSDDMTKACGQILKEILPYKQVRQTGSLTG